MFDWNDEELSNIVLDEGVESDHIVPYPEAKEDYGKRKERKFSEQKEKVGIHGRKLEISSNFKFSEGLDIGSWPDLSLSMTTAKADQDSQNTSVSDKLNEKAVQLDKDSQLFQKGKEQGDFVDYGWDNIGSFDDFDRIFSNDDPIFGCVSPSDADELWASSKDVTNSPDKPFPLFSDSQTLSNASASFEDDHPFTVDYVPSSHSLQNACGAKINFGTKEQPDLTMMGKNTPLTAAAQLESSHKVHKQKKSSKSQKRLEDPSDVELHQNSYGNWCSVPGQFAPSILNPSPSVLSQARPLHGPRSLQYQLISNPYGTLPTIPVLSHVGDFRNQSVYEVSSGKPGRVNKLADSTQTMTPQEKIEKLRKRQQMQALLAIQKQQQQIGDQTILENQHQLIEGADVEADDQSSLAPVESDESSSMSLAVDEDILLYRLQHIIGKMDVRIRLGIRDSLFRLAQSALQRHTGSNNNSSREEIVVTKEQLQNRKVAESETNPIDRTVAHLLFHRSMELLPETPASRNLPSV